MREFDADCGPISEEIKKSGRVRDTTKAVLWERQVKKYLCIFNEPLFKNDRKIIPWMRKGNAVPYLDGKTRPVFD